MSRASQMLSLVALGVTVPSGCVQEEAQMQTASAQAGSTGASTSTGGRESSGASTSSGPDEPDEPDEPTVSCDGLDESSCANTEGCSPRTGAPIEHDGEDACRGDSEFLGCEQASWCHAIVVIACASPQGQPYWFGSDCYPEGWIPCRPHVFPTEDCPQRPAEAYPATRRRSD